MESVQKFYDGMDNSPSDLNSLQAFAQAGIDHVVVDGISSANRYSGFAISKTGTTTVGLLPGRLYNAGIRYACNQPTVQDFIQNLPIAGTAIVLAVVAGATSDSNVQPREFLLDDTTGASESRAVALETDRTSTVTFVIGQSGANPSPPVPGAGYTVIATIILGPAGVLSVQNNASTMLPSVEGNSSRLSAVESFEDTISGQVGTLASDLANLARGLNTTGITQDLLGRMLTRIASLEAKTGIPDNAADSSTDYFLDLTSSDTANPLFVAKVDEGIRFAAANANQLPIGLFNASDPNAKLMNGILFPTYTEGERLNIGPAVSDVQPNSYSYQTLQTQQKTMSRSRTRYGSEFTVCSNSAFWNSGNYDPISGIFTLNDGETFNASVDISGGVVETNTSQGSHIMVRLQEYWTDNVTSTYWDAVTVQQNLSGSQIAETFLSGQGFWLSSIDLLFTSIDTVGAAPVSVTICECNETGSPDFNSVLSTCTVNAANLKLASSSQTTAVQNGNVIQTNVYSDTPTNFPFAAPVYLSAGTRYAVVVTTTGNHRIATADGTSFPQGTFLTLTAGGFAVADLSKHIAMRLHNCSFTNPSTTLPLTSLQLAGGITSIDILSGAIIPASCTLIFEMNVNNAWVPVSPANIAALNSGGNLPPLVPFRVTMLGTPDVMPAIDTLHSLITITLPRTTFCHISKVRQPPAATASIRVMERYEGFNATYNTGLLTLLTGGAYATEVQPTSHTDVITADGALERTYVFNLGAAVTSYKIKSNGATTTVLQSFLVAWRKDWVL